MERINMYFNFYKLIVLHIYYYSSTYLSLNPTSKTVCPTADDPHGRKPLRFHQ